MNPMIPPDDQPSLQRTASEPGTHLLAPSEWLIFRVVSRSQAPMTLDDIGRSLPTLPPTTVRTLVDRMGRRGILRQSRESWVSASRDHTGLLCRAFENFLESFDLEAPEELEALLHVLESRLRRALKARRT
jgi:hypothetical protein